METIKEWLSKSYIEQYKEVVVLKGGDRLFSGNKSALKNREDLLSMECDEPSFSGVLTFRVK